MKSAAVVAIGLLGAVAYFLWDGHAKSSATILASLEKVQSPVVPSSHRFVPSIPNGRNMQRINQPVYRSGGLLEDILYGSALDADDPTKFMVRIMTDYDPAIMDWQNYEKHTFTASYAIRQVSAKGLDHFYILGETASGDAVIERWKRAPVLPGGGGSAYRLRRRELYRGSGLGVVHRILADPDGRYVLILHDSTPAKLSKMTLPPVVA